MTLESRCLLASKCKKAGDEDYCQPLCFPFRKLHGESGDGGIWGLADIPKGYATCSVFNMPFAEDNPKAAKAVRAYVGNIIENVDQGVGFYMYGVPNLANTKGTGTGKTTAACTILNEYLSERVILHIKQERIIDEIPAIFVNVSKFQNLFNSQFRGPQEMKDEASRRYYSFKSRMMQAQLVVMDDIGVRDATEAFMNEFYEIIDERISEERATIFTSNVPLSEIASKLDERIASRIDGSTIKLAFQGDDKRKRGVL